MNTFLKKLIIKISYLISLMLLLVGGVLFSNYAHKTDYPATLMDKYKRLDSLKNNRKIIICGGSSSSYSINSEKLQNVFNLPVVNTSLAMSLGSNFHLNLTKGYLLKGDIVLYTPEYEFYYGKTTGDDFLYTTAFYAPEMLKDFTLDQKKEMLAKSVKLSFDFYIGSLKKYLRKKESKTKQYSRLAYNYIGDNITLVDEKNSLIKSKIINRYDKLKSKEISKAFIEKLKEFNNLCESLGVTFIIAFPPIEKSQFSNHFIEAINLVKKAATLNFIGNPEEEVYEKELFYDTSYHLVGKGREIRTGKLIKQLQKERVFK
jgi:hypothetical protein